jgi:hypothetical protein
VKGEVAEAMTVAGSDYDYGTMDRESAIVLISRQKVTVIQLDGDKGFSVAKLGCRTLAAGSIHLRGSAEKTFHFE